MTISFFGNFAILRQSEVETDMIAVRLRVWLKGNFVGIVLPALLLSLVVIYSGWMASIWMSNNADALISSHISAEPWKRGALHLGSIHSNLFKFPLLAAQGHLPYDFVSFVLVNLGLLAATVFGWIALLCMISSWRYFAFYCVGWLFLLLGTSHFSPEIIYITARNIEFPLFLLFLYLIYQFIEQGKWKLLAAFLPFFVILTAGDLYILYVGVPAVVVPATVALLQTTKPQRQIRRRLLQAIAIAVGAAVAAKLLLFALEALDIFRFVYPEEKDSMLIALKDVIPGFLTSFQSLLNYMGVNVLSTPIRGDIYARAVFLLLVLAIIALYIRRIPVWFRSILNVRFRFIYAALSVATIVTMILYVLTARWGIPSTQRYLTLLPLCWFVVLPILLPAYRRAVLKAKNISSFQRQQLISRKMLLSFGAVLLVAFGFLVNDTQQQFGLQKESVITQRSFYSRVHEIADKEGVKIVVAGFWQASPIEFWTNGALTSVGITQCDKPMPYLSHRFDYKATSEKTMLIVDRVGIDASVWEKCPKDVDITAMYGNPMVVHQSTNAYGEPVEVWIFAHDIRAHLNMQEY